MPGNIVSLKCPCGFRKEDLFVGVSENLVHSTFAMCLECGRIVALRKKPGGQFGRTCPACGRKLILTTDPAAWEPAELQQKFPGEEPWLVKNCISGLAEEKEAGRYHSLCDEIRLLCPGCKKYALKCDGSGLWD